jgi:hypothetical protein
VERLPMMKNPSYALVKATFSLLTSLKNPRDVELFLTPEKTM